MNEDSVDYKAEEQAKLAEELYGQSNPEPVDYPDPTALKMPAAERRGRSGWLLGAVLILAGLVLLASNFFPHTYSGNWWAFFILLPAAGSFQRAWAEYDRHGRLTDRARSSLVGGLLIASVAFIFIFGLSFGNWWPLLLIIIGFGALLKGLRG